MFGFRGWREVRRNGCMKMLFTEVGKRFVNCKIHGVKRTQPSINFNNNNNIYLLQLGCHPVAVVI
jgi:hypothetical protein